MKMFCKVALLLLITGFVSRSVPAFAQQTGISGVVADVQGGVIPGAKVTVKQTGGSTFDATTNAQGDYVVPNLTAAEYTVTVTAPGFATVEKKLLLLVGQLAQIDVKLPIASTSTSVLVEASDQLAIDTTSSVVAGNVTPKEVQDVPINGRNYIQLSTLIPGIKANAFGNSPVSGPGGSSQGDAETGKFQITLDGLEASQDSVGSSFGQPKFSQDAISQFQIITNRFDATSGRSAGIYVNVQSKTGTDQMHGGAFLYERNSAFFASDPVLKLAAAQDHNVTTTRPQYADEQYGGTLGGSIRKNRLWYFGSYEGEHSPSTTNISPTITQGLASSIYSHPSVLLNNEYLGRLDYQRNDKNHFFLRGDGFTSSTSFIAPTSAGADPSQAYYSTVSSYGYVFDWNKNISDHLINDVHAGLHYFQFQNLPFFSTTGSIVVTLPAVTVGEPYNEPEIFNQYTQQYRDDLFWLKGKHSVKMGGEFLYTHHGGQFPQYLRGGLTSCSAASGAIPNYAAMFPNGTLNPSTWNYAAINSYCSVSEAFTQAFGQYDITINRNIIGVWAQDDWKILPRLTLNLGLRYDNDLGAYNTGYVPTPGLLTPNTNPNANFGPRLGFSYDPGGDGKTSIRGGAGLYYADQVANAVIDEELYSSTARALQATVSGTNLSLPTPFAGQNPSANPTNYVNSPQPILRGAKTPYSLEASFGVARELPFKTTLSADFVHTRVYDDFVALSGNLLQNPANPEQNLNPGTAMSAATYATRICGNGGITLDTLNTATLSTDAPSNGLATGQSAKQVCNQIFGAAVRNFSTQPGAGVIADALQVGLKHATTNGFTGAVAYTWGRVKNSTNGAFGYSNKPFIPGLQQEWADGTDDQRHTLTVNGEYQWKYGLSLSGLYHFGSGLAFATLSGATVNGYSPTGDGRTFTAQPIAGPAVGACPTGSVCSWAPLSKVHLDAGYGYYIIARDSFRGSDYNRVDSRLQEDVKIKERYHAIFAVEVFNIFNHTNFGNFAATASNANTITAAGATFGLPSQTAYGHPSSVNSGTAVEYFARNMQFIGRFQF